MMIIQLIFLTHGFVIGVLLFLLLLTSNVCAFSALTLLVGL